jgi:hypothetical protein
MITRCVPATALDILDVSRAFAWQNLMDYIRAGMGEQDRLERRLKAQAFDRLVQKYRTLENEDGFYSRNWVELSEQLESELRQLRRVLGKDSLEPQ